MDELYLEDVTRMTAVRDALFAYADWKLAPYRAAYEKAIEAAEEAYDASYDPDLAYYSDDYREPARKAYDEALKAAEDAYDAAYQAIMQPYFTASEALQKIYKALKD